MEDQLITFDTAKLAKDKGFDWKVLNCYNENEEIGDNEDNFFFNYNIGPTIKGSNTNLYSIPTQSLLQKWLRKQHNILIEITGNNFNSKLSIKVYFQNQIATKPSIATSPIYDEYEEALEEGLIKALKLI
jgi:hypothetical protein